MKALHNLEDFDMSTSTGAFLIVFVVPEIKEDGYQEIKKLGSKEANQYLMYFLWYVVTIAKKEL